MALMAGLAGLLASKLLGSGYITEDELEDYEDKIAEELDDGGGETIDFMVVEGIAPKKMLENIGGALIGGRKKKKGRPKKLTAYQRHVKAQMKKGKSMRQAAQSWRKSHPKKRKTGRKRGKGVPAGGSLIGGMKGDALRDMYYQTQLQRALLPAAATAEDINKAMDKVPSLARYTEFVSNPLFIEREKMANTNFAFQQAMNNRRELLRLQRELEDAKIDQLEKAYKKGSYARNVKLMAELDKAIANDNTKIKAFLNTDPFPLIGDVMV